MNNIVNFKVYGKNCITKLNNRNMKIKSTFVQSKMFYEYEYQSCEIHRDFQNAIKNCWAPYSQSIEDKSDFLPTFRQMIFSLSIYLTILYIKIFVICIQLFRNKNFIFLIRRILSILYLSLYSGKRHLKQLGPIKLLKKWEAQEVEKYLERL